MTNKPVLQLPLVLGVSLLLSACENLQSAEPVDGEPVQVVNEPTDTVASMTVYKSPTCGCCQGWVDYMASEGFDVEVVDTESLESIKMENGLTSPELHSCHTALVDGYVVEGHVPVGDVRRLLTERPDILGLTAPGMPMMSPGMASLTPKDYDVIAVDDDGQTQVWSSY